MKTALSIAGSDSCGGAGIQADIKTMTLNGVYAMSAITALTAQNTTGVRGVQEATPDFLAQQIDAVFEDMLFALNTAKTDGFPTVGIYDRHEAHQDELKGLADYYVLDFTDPILKTI